MSAIYSIQQNRKVVYNIQTMCRDGLHKKQCILQGRKAIGNKKSERLREKKEKKKKTDGRKKKEKEGNKRNNISQTGNATGKNWLLNARRR